MPFTLSHPAAVVPLARRGLSFSALVMGSMTPDLPYFVLPSQKNNFGHTWLGGVELGIPLGLLVLWLFHAFLKFPLLSLLSPAQRQRLWPVATGFRWGNARGFMLIVLSLCIGIATHLIWDNLTHYYGWYQFYERWHWPFSLVVNMTQPIITTPSGPLFLFDIMQYASSILGLLYMLFCYLRWFRSADSNGATPEPPFSELTRKRLLWSGIATMLAVGIFSAYASLKFTSLLSTFAGLQILSRRAVILSLKLGILEVFVFSLWWNSRKMRLKLKR